MNTISLVPKEQVRNIWPTVEPLLAKAIAYLNGRVDTIDIYIGILQGAQTLWVSFDEEKKVTGCLIVKIIDYPNTRVCSVDYAAGEGVDDWLEKSFGKIMAYAREFGCQRMEAFGRKGWTPRARKLGWKDIGVRFDYEIPQGDD